MKKIVNLNNQDDWDSLLSETGNSAEIIIFKSSPFCGTSALCEKRFDEWFDDLEAETGIICAKVDVVAARPLSNFLAKEFNIRHESPQVLWLDKNRKVKWHKSHFAITVEALSGLLT